MWSRISIAVAVLVFATAESAPQECRQYEWLPADRRGTTLAWNQVLSLASCLQDASTPRVTNVGELAPMVATTFRRLAPAMMLDLAALQRGPESVQLRAAYQIGMIYVAAIVRARAAIASDALGARALRAELEDMLASAKRTARIVFVAIDRAVADDPTIDRDPVAHYMIESSRTLIGLLAEPTELAPPTYTWVRAD
jgi:hypothetical protein